MGSTIFNEDVQILRNFAGEILAQKLVANTGLDARLRGHGELGKRSIDVIPAKAGIQLQVHSRLCPLFLRSYQVSSYNYPYQRNRRNPKNE